jgi:hypothetical protein
MRQDIASDKEIGCQRRHIVGGEQALWIKHLSWQKHVCAKRG